MDGLTIFDSNDIKEFGLVIHEFDPWFNFRVNTKVCRGYKMLNQKLSDTQIMFRISSKFGINL